MAEAYKHNSYIIKISDDDFKNYECNWEDLPDTMSFTIEIIRDENGQKIKFSGGGGSSGANLLGRFCHGDEKLFSHTKKMIVVEEKINNNKILAEIVHLPESRVGNVLMRPDFRKYEIPYLAKSLKPEENQLHLHDLMVSVKNNSGVFLRSKKYNKEVIPHLTTAHNYSNNSLPIYHFLCDLQTQGLRRGVGFNFGPFADSYEFLPRIEYENLIIHDATWNLNKKHIEPLLKVKNEDSELITATKNFRGYLQIPSYAMLADRDNELLVNFENLTSVRMFLDIVGKRDEFKL